MCSPTRRRPPRRRGVAALALALALLGSMAPDLGAQSVEELVQRLDSLQPLLAQAERADAAADREARLRAREELGLEMDTVRVGPLRIVTPVDQAADARRAFEEVWGDAAPRVGEATGALPEMIWTFQYAPRLHRLHMFVTERAERRKQVHIRSWEPWERVLRAVESTVWEVLGQSLEGEVGDLVDSAWGGWWPVTPGVLEGAHRVLLTAPGRPARACVGGDVEACWVAMGADGVPDRWEEWYEPAERRAFVMSASRERFRGTRGVGARMDACDEGDQAACDDLLNESMDPWIPVRGMARTRIVAHAVELGGEGAYERLAAADDGDLREALSRAAGIEADEVMASWRSRILEHRPEVAGGTGRSQWTTLFWVVVLGTLAMGSTRWRVG